MKSPMNQRPDEQAHLDTESFVAKYSRKPGTQPKGRKAPAKRRAATAKAAATDSSKS